jgi:hypothetical protein
MSIEFLWEKIKGEWLWGWKEGSNRSYNWLMKYIWDKCVKNISVWFTQKNYYIKDRINDKYYININKVIIEI